MKRIKQFNKLKLLLGIILLFLTACENREWDNPFDPGCPKEIFTPTNFFAIQEGEQVILSWGQSNTNISGFKIERQVESESFSAIASPGKNENSATNNISAGGKQHTYKLYALAGSNKSNEVTTSITPVLQAAVTTKAVTEITDTSAISGGTVTDDGGGTVTARGVVWNTTDSPTLENNSGKTTDGSGTGSFTSELAGLDDGSEYFVRAYATNTEGTNYGDTKAFSTVDITLPEVTTAEVTNITTNSAQCGGEVVSDGNSQVTVRGVVWNTTGTPTLENYEGKTDDGNGTGSFISSLTDLIEGTIYYVRAFATNKKGTQYGEQIDFIIDVEGNVYRIVTIGSQIWMAENLKTTTYNDGSTIPNITDNTEWSNLTTGAYCWYDNDIENKAIYGALYNWHTVNTGKLCPTSWHVPSDEEWEDLAQFINDEMGPYGKSGDDWAYMGQLLKTTSGWYNGGNGTDDFGFSGIPSGWRNKDGYFDLIGKIAFWWSKTEKSTNNVYSWCRYVSYSPSHFQKNYYFKERGFSIRCIKD
jgi:uncharacterized protein (TIGR02145 family)